MATPGTASTPPPSEQAPTGGRVPNLKVKAKKKKRPVSVEAVGQGDEDEAEEDPEFRTPRSCSIRSQPRQPPQDRLIFSSQTLAEDVWTHHAGTGSISPAQRTETDGCTNTIQASGTGFTGDVQLDCTNS